MVFSLALSHRLDLGSVGTAWSVCVTSTVLAADEASGTLNTLSVVPVSNSTASMERARTRGEKRTSLFIFRMPASAGIINLLVGAPLMGALLRGYFFAILACER